MGVDINVYRAAIGNFSNASRNNSITSFNQFQIRKRQRSVKLKTHLMIRWLNILVLLCVGLSVELNENKFRNVYENKILVKPILFIACQPCSKTRDKLSLNIVQTFYPGDQRWKTFYSFKILAINIQSGLMETERKMVLDSVTLTKETLCCPTEY